MKILIIHTAFIGDIVLSTPLIQKTKDIYPNSEIDYLTLPANKSIINNNPNLRNILTYDKKGEDKGIKGFLKILKIIKENKYDMAIIPHRFIRSIALARFAGIKKIIGFDVATGSFLLTEKKHYDMSKHEVERLLTLLDYEGEKVPLKIYPSEKDYLKIRNILDSKKYDKLITVAPGSQRPEKIWPLEKYGELIKKIAENKKNLVVTTGGKTEKKLPLKLENFENIVDLRGELSLLEFSALLSLSDIIVSNDSAPVHIGSAFEKPFIIGIFGPGKKSLGFFPWTEKSNVIEDNTFFENNILTEYKGTYSYSKDYFKGIPEITVERVYEEIMERLE
ncbi:lipopolysaccharide heptosyltransferase family protein [Leptotrichia sp. OH3620_COT-345]|uniref:glycosyltransferase family 9 protein n=1 Tax=Leptotrichia sp. OH3620_COT-345 TaxID=2491048 RepID=UPI000F6506A8|nr:glycosyltransferase family 9 protein [Leptotrichia sp. OH3620_COT-345]RRD40769.1 lipopolysaccharide heptosyltransferase family protein [Leptotrichia sp. OH3620_COT-345]